MHHAIRFQMFLIFFFSVAIALSFISHATQAKLLADINKYNINKLDWKRGIKNGFYCAHELTFQL